MTDQLWRAALAVDQAVIALRRGAAATAFVAALDQAHAAVQQLPPGLTEQVLSALLYEIEECRRRRCRNSPSLQMHIRFAAVAVANEANGPPRPPPRPPGYQQQRLGSGVLGAIGSAMTCLPRMAHSRCLRPYGNSWGNHPCSTYRQARSGPRFGHVAAVYKARAARYPRPERGPAKSDNIADLKVKYEQVLMRYYRDEVLPQRERARQTGGQSQ